MARLRCGTYLSIAVGGGGRYDRELTKHHLVVLWQVLQVASLHAREVFGLEYSQYSMSEALVAHHDAYSCQPDVHYASPIVQPLHTICDILGHLLR